MDTARRPKAQAAIHPVGSGHSFCASAQHHTDVTLSHTHTRLRTQLLHECLAPQTSHTDTHTHSLQQRTLTFRHTHGSGHSFGMSAWHHTDVTHTLHSSAHSHSDSSGSPGTWATERHPLQPHLPRLVPTRQLSLSP